MSYNILDAIRDEIKFCKDAVKLCNEYDDKAFLRMVYREQAYSLERILSRLEEGKDFSINFERKRIITTETDRKSDEVLERENPALKTAGEHYRMVKTLVQD